MTRDEQDAISADFNKAVNMTPSALRTWLATDESRSVGMAPDGEKITHSTQSEAVGHHMGERILEIRATRHTDLTEQDYRDMRKVVGYVHRHMAQRPKGKVVDTRWRRSLMNWGHDPLRDE